MAGPSRDADSPQGEPAPDDEQFELAWAAWRQFFALRLDRPAPTQPEIDDRLWRYRRVHEGSSLAEFACALILAAGIARALTLLAERASAIALTTATSVAVLLLTGLLLLALAQSAFRHLRTAMEQRALARRIDVNPLERERLHTLFADVADPEVRSYINAVLTQGRSLRRAEAAVALDRGRGAGGLEDASRQAFTAAVRGRGGGRGREIAIAAACGVALLAASGGDVEAVLLLPALYLLGAAVLAGLPATLAQLALDPWRLAGGGPACRRLRAGLAADTLPQLAVFAVVVITVTALA